MLTPGRLYIGQTVSLTVNITNDADADTDATTLACLVMDPAGSSTTYTYGTDANVTRESAGDYICDVTPDQSGRWLYRWVATDASAYTVIDAGSFVVQASPFHDDSRDAYRS